MRPFWKNDRREDAGEVPSAEAAGSPEAAEMAERVLRLAAELENVRKRARREVETARRLERAEVAGAFLQVLDNVERALAADSGGAGAWREGLEGIRRQFEETLGRLGITRVEDLGVVFNPEWHEAVATAPAGENTPEGTVVEVAQPGYRMADGELLRPARVVVAR
jgi:molecular chaperone GrpE